MNKQVNRVEKRPYLWVLAFVLLALGAGEIAAIPPQCERVMQAGKTYRSSDIDSPFAAAWNSLSSSKPCFGRVEEGGQLDRVPEVTEQMADYAYTAFVRAKWILTAAICIAGWLFGFFVTDSLRRKRLENTAAEA